MTQYYIVEIQQYWSVDETTGVKTPGEFGHIIHFAFDENATKARLKAESKYHEVLAAAAVSELPQHSATLLTSDGRCVMNQCYRHEAEVTPEPTTEPTTEPVEEETTPTE